MEDSDIAKRIESIDKLVQDKPSLLPECSMYRVHRGLREVKPEAYEPVLVSIGPYHYKKPKLQAMEEHKLRYLRSLLERTEDVSVKRYYLELAKLEESARMCYVQSTDDLMSKDEFVEMMLLDGCFIIEYFHKIESLWSVIVKGDCIKGDSIVKDDPILQVDWMVHQVCVDFLLLENQIPYFVLSKLYGMTLVTNSNDQVAPDANAALRELATTVFNYVLPRPRKNFISDGGGNSTTNVRHLLHLVHILCTPALAPALAVSLVPAPAPAPAPAPSSQERIPKRSIDTHEVEWTLLEAGNTKKDSEGHSDSSPKKEDVKEPILEQRRSAVELQEAGVKFKEAGEVNRTDTAASLFDITFYNGRMGIPRFQVNDWTETMFRNFIAFEQHSFDVQPKYFTDFASFFDQLINSEKDVKLLRLKGIIENLLGDDKKVSDIFNKLGDGILISPDFCYSQQCEELNKHCKRFWNRWMETLWSNYFHTPWAGVSTIAAFMLLVLTLIQTVAALMS